MKEDQRIQKGEMTKQKILQASLLIIAQEGLKGLSASKVAKEAGVSKSNVFHHFSSIEEIPKVLISSLCSLMTGERKTFKDLETFFNQLGINAFPTDEENLRQYKALFSFYYEVLFTKTFSEELAGLKEDFVVYLIQEIKAISNKDLPTDLAEMIAIDLDALGLHYLIEQDYNKYAQMWAKKSSFYIGQIEELTEA